MIEHLEGYGDKIRVVLNKADSMDPSELLKINSALTWALSRILKTPEVSFQIISHHLPLSPTSHPHLTHISPTSHPPPTTTVE